MRSSAACRESRCTDVVGNTTTPPGRKRVPGWEQGPEQETPAATVPRRGAAARYRQRGCHGVGGRATTIVLRDHDGPESIAPVITSTCR
jgi:hypothetical protein